MATRDYRLLLPKDTTVPAACEQVRCENWLYGWDTSVDERTPAGRDAAAWVRQRSGRTFREISGGGNVTVFRFEPHQRCFAEHRTHPSRFIVRQGAVVRRHAWLGDWISDFGEHYTQLEDQVRRG